MTIQIRNVWDAPLEATLNKHPQTLVLSVLLLMAAIRENDLYIEFESSALKMKKWVLPFQF